MSMMVHPAYVDKTLMKLSSYNIIRATELEALLDPKVIAFIKENNIVENKFNLLELYGKNEETKKLKEFILEEIRKKEIVC